MGVPMPPGRVHSGPPTLGVSSKGLISEPGLPGRSRPGGPTAIHFFGPFDTPSGTNLESAIRRPTGPAAMPPAAPGRCLVVADPRPGHLQRQHRKDVSPSDEHRLLNGLGVVTREVVEAAREVLVIGMA